MFKYLFLLFRYMDAIKKGLDGPSPLKNMYSSKTLAKCRRLRRKYALNINIFWH